MTLCLALTGSLTGCAGSGGQGRAVLTIDEALRTTADAPDALTRLRQLARMEANGGAGWATARRVASPPGVEPATLLADEANANARVSLQDAIGHLRDEPVTIEADDAFSGPPPSDAERVEARAAYDKGVQAIANRQFYVAVIELEKAHQLDPTDADILQALAGACTAAGNRARARSLYEQIFLLDPTQGVAAVELATEATDRRDFGRAGAILSRAWSGVGQDLAVDFLLGSTLSQLGYDAASEPLLVSAASIPIDQVNADDARSLTARMYRQRGELWRTIGDQRCRSERYSDAIDAYDAASDLPLTDPASLLPRQAFARISLGRVFSAQLIAAEAVVADGGPGMERITPILEYMRRHADPVDVLATTLLERYASMPQQSDLLRAVSGLLSAEQAGVLYQEHLEEHPDDIGAVLDLIADRAGRNVVSAVDLAVSVSSDRPELITDIVSRIRDSDVEVDALLAALESRGDVLAAARLRGAVLASHGASGPAWSVLEEARSRWPDDVSLAVQQVLLATSMGEAMLVRSLLDEIPELQTPMQKLAVASAWQLIGESDRASERATEAVDQLGDEPDAEVLSTAAAIHVAVAQGYHQQYVVSSRTPSATTASLQDAVSRAAMEATNLALRTLSIEPDNEAAFGVLISAYSPATGVLPDADRYAELLASLRDASPDSALYGRLEAEQAIRRRRHEFAIERLIALLQAHPDDQQALDLLILAWRSKGDSTSALQWVESQLRDRTDDPLLLKYWAELKVARGETDPVVARLSELSDRQPYNHHVIRVLEQLHRAMGQVDEAIALGEVRLLSRPQAAARELELAAMYAGAGRDEQAIPHLQWITENAEQVESIHMSEAVTVASRLNQTDLIEREHMVLRLVDAAISHEPDIALQTFGLGLLALTRLADFGEDIGDDGFDERFESMVRTAARSATGASGTSLTAATHWRDMAQAMVDAGEMDAASRAINIRLERGIEANRAIRAAERTGPATELDPGLVDEALTVLTRCAIILDAATDDPQHTIDLINLLDRRGQLVSLPGMQGDPTVDEALYLAGGLNTVLGNDAGAEVILRYLVQRTPGHHMGLNNLGYMRINSNHDDAESVGWVERAYELAPFNENILDTYGWLKYKQGRFDEEEVGAVTLIRQAADATPEPSVEVLDHLGDALWRAGRNDEAVSAWKRLEAYIDRSGLEDFLVQSYRNFQTGPQSWLLLVVDPTELYDRDYGAVLRRARMKLRSADEGAEPVLAPTFEEARR